MPSSDIPALDETPRPVPVDPETARKASLAMAWRVGQGKLTHEQAKQALVLLGLAEDDERTMSRAEIATANRRASMERLRARQAAQKDEGAA